MKITTHIQDKNGKEIFEGDNLFLSFDTLAMIGIAKKNQTDGEWELYANENNHVPLEHNKHRIEIMYENHLDGTLLSTAVNNMK